LGSLDRREHLRGGRASAEEQTASGAGLPRLLGAIGSGATVRARTTRGGEHLGGEVTKSEPKKRAIDLKNRTRSTPSGDARRTRLARSPECARPQVLPLKTIQPSSRSDHVDAKHLRNPTAPETARHDPCLGGAARNPHHARPGL